MLFIGVGVLGLTFLGGWLVGSFLPLLSGGGI